MTTMKEKEEINVVPYFFIFLLLLLLFFYFYFFYYMFIIGRIIIFYLFLGYIYLHVSLYIVCVAYPLNVRSTMEIRRLHLCDFFLVLPFFITFSYKILCCK